MAEMGQVEYYLFGTILKSFGVKGEFVVLPNVDEPQDYLNIDTVFIGIGSTPVPFFVESLQYRNNGTYIMKLQDINTPEEASRLLKKELFLPQALMPEPEDSHFYYYQIIGYEVSDTGNGYIGEIVDFIENPEQDLLVVDKQGQEVLIPMVDEFIVRIDHKKKSLLLELPEGLIDLYLNE